MHISPWILIATACHLIIFPSRSSGTGKYMALLSPMMTMLSSKILTELELFVVNHFNEKYHVENT